MDNPRSISGNGEDYVGIPDDLRCKRTDGKQWRCTARSMPDKTVCEKHYIQAKKRAANSALRASLKKAKRSSLDENDMYLDSRNDDLDESSVDATGLDYPISLSGRKYKDQYEEDERFYNTPPSFSMDASPNRPVNVSDANETEEYSDGSSDPSDESGGQPCHQCRRNDRERVIWCLKCEKRGYCDSCVSTWYSDIPLEEIERACPACLGTCVCKVCLRVRAENLIKTRIREIPVPDKLLYLYYLLSSVLPIVKKIHHDQCSEVEIETRVRGTDLNLSRRKLNADEQMCCNFCRTPIIDYHRHCGKCSYDLCLSCCKDLREASIAGDNRDEVERNQTGRSHENEAMSEQVTVSRPKLISSDKFPEWKADSHGGIPCPPREYGGCGYPSLTLCRIFKMNWVAKLIKNTEEMVSGCKVYDTCSPPSSGLSDSRLCQSSHREDSNDNLLYCPLSEDILTEGTNVFRRHWLKGQPVIVMQVCDSNSSSDWDPVVIWRRVQEITDKKLKDNKLVKAISCLIGSEVNIELDRFIEGYSEGQTHESGRPEMLKLKSWPSPSVSEEFLSCQKPEFISKLPLLEYVHYKWGVLNVAAKLPHYTLQNDVGPKILISHGAYEELGRGDSVTNLHFRMSDMMYVLLHTHKVKLKDGLKTKMEKIQKGLIESTAEESSEVPPAHLDEGSPLVSGHCENNEYGAKLNDNKDTVIGDQDAGTANNEEKSDDIEEKNDNVKLSSKNCDEDAENANINEKTDETELATKNCDQDIENVIIKEKRDEIELASKYCDQDIENIFIKEKSDEIELASKNCDQDIEIADIKEKNDDIKLSTENNGDVTEKTYPGALWDVFRRQDVPKLIEFVKLHRKEFGEPDHDSVDFTLYDEVVYLNKYHKEILKEKFGVEPWTFEQHIGEAVFIPAGCPFQVRNLQSTVQLSLDFLSPESLGEAEKLYEEIRCLPNDHEVKPKMLELGKMSLYAASSAIKEVQKLVLDPKLKAEIEPEDPNLTKMVSENLGNMMKLRQVACA